MVVDAEDVAVDDGLQVHRRRVERDDEEAGGEEEGKDEADDGVLTQHGQAFQEEHGGSGKDAGGEGAEGVRQAPQVGERDAGDDGMGEGVANERPAFEHEVHREQGADAADRRAAQ